MHKALLQKWSRCCGQGEQRRCKNSTCSQPLLQPAALHSPAVKAYLPSRMAPNTMEYKHIKDGILQGFFVLALGDPFQFSMVITEMRAFRLRYRNFSSCLQVLITTWPCQWTGSPSPFLKMFRIHTQTHQNSHLRKGDEHFEGEPLLQSMLTSSNGRGSRYCLWALDENNDRLGEKEPNTGRLGAHIQ